MRKEDEEEEEEEYEDLLVRGHRTSPRRQRREPGVARFVANRSLLIIRRPFRSEKKSFGIFRIRGGMR